MRPTLGLGLSFMALAVGVSAGYHPDVEKVSDFPAGIKVVALVLKGPRLPSVDCLKFEDHAVERLQEIKSFTIIPMANVRQAMFDIGMTEFDTANGPALLDRLGADTLCEAAILGVGINVCLRQTAKVEVRMISKDGKMLMRGQCYGVKTGFPNLNKELRNTFDEIIDKAFK